MEFIKCIIISVYRLNAVRKVTIIDDGRVRGFINIDLPPNSISTVIYHNLDEAETSTNRAAETTYQWNDSLSKSTLVQVPNTLFILLLSTCLFHVKFYN